MIGVVSVESQVFEVEVVDVHQSHSTIQIVAVVGVIVVDDDLVAVVALERNVVDLRLSHIVFGDIEVLVGAGTEVEGGGTVHTAVSKGCLHRIHVREVGVRAAYGVMAIQKAVASESGIVDGIVAMITIRLSITGSDVSGDIVVTLCGDECAQ